MNSPNPAPTFSTDPLGRLSTCVLSSLGTVVRVDAYSKLPIWRIDLEGAAGEAYRWIE
jgi:hypothetical protein